MTGDFFWKGGVQGICMICVAYEDIFLEVYISILNPSRSKSVNKFQDIRHVQRNWAPKKNQGANTGPASGRKLQEDTHWLRPNESICGASLLPEMDWKIQLRKWWDNVGYMMIYGYNVCIYIYMLMIYIYIRYISKRILNVLFWSVGPHCCPPSERVPGRLRYNLQKLYDFKDWRAISIKMT